MKKIQHAKKGPFCLFLQQKKHTISGLLFYLKGVQNEKENKTINDLYLVLVGNFFGPYEYTKFSLINSLRKRFT